MQLLNHPEIDLHWTKLERDTVDEHSTGLLALARPLAPTGDLSSDQRALLAGKLHEVVHHLRKDIGRLQDAGDISQVVDIIDKYDGYRFYN